MKMADGTAVPDRAIKVYRRAEVQIHTVFTPATVAGKWSTSAQAALPKTCALLGNNYPPLPDPSYECFRQFTYGAKLLKL
jgi:hypothetical protein